MNYKLPSLHVLILIRQKNTDKSWTRNEQSKINEYDKRFS
jgi:hypothetical protein